MTLPASPNRSWLLSFWLAMSLCIGLITGALSWILISPAWAGCGVLVALALAMSGVLRPQLLVGPYRFWNRLAVKFAGFAQMCVTGICFYIVFVAVGRTGASLGLAHPNSNSESLWTPRETLVSSAYISHDRATSKGLRQRGWFDTFLPWAIRSGNVWACCLLPFLILLRTLETGEESGFPSNTYTLY